MIAHRLIEHRRARGNIPNIQDFRTAFQLLGLALRPSAWERQISLLKTNRKLTYGEPRDGELCPSHDLGKRPLTAIKFASLASGPVRYSRRVMLGRRLRKILDQHVSLRDQTAILGVGRDLWMTAIGSVAYLSNYLMQVKIEIDHLPYIIVFVS
jgi:hypothetical protein